MYDMFYEFNNEYLSTVEEFSGVPALKLLVGGTRSKMGEANTCA